jgi:hypothetical protein
MPDRLSQNKVFVNAHERVKASDTQFPPRVLHLCKGRAFLSVWKNKIEACGVLDLGGGYFRFGAVEFIPL